MKKGSNTKPSIFDTFKIKGELTGEANRQRAIITILASNANPAERTRTGTSQSIAKRHGIAWKNIYSGIFRDLDEILIPLEIAEEGGRLPLKRGPKDLQKIEKSYLKRFFHNQIQRKKSMRESLKVYQRPVQILHIQFFKNMSRHFVIIKSKIYSHLISQNLRIFLTSL